MNKCILLLLLALQIVLISAAQTNEQLQLKLSNGTLQTTTADTTSLLHAFKKGQFTGHARYFFMSTQNEKELTDYYADALGAGIRFETAKFHHFQFAISGSSIVNIGSSNLTKPDSLTGQYSRYETGLFDITNPGNKKDISRLDELYLRYHFNQSFIKAGRQFINSSFINMQDGRMSPTAVSGIWAEINEIKKIKLQLGWIWGISPRSTTGWYKPGSSIGIYAVGVNPDGSKSGYENNVTGNGIGILQATIKIGKPLKLLLSNMFVQNIFNSTLLQVDYNHTFKNNSTVFAALQAVKQFALQNGGNANQSKSYFQRAATSFSFGARAGWKNRRWETSINYNRITAEGRYLVPREWGTDPFFTLLPRERNDGFGDVQAVVGKLSFTAPKTNIKAAVAFGYYQLPDVKNFALNKYGLPSYTEAVADLKYIFTKALKGLDVQFLLIGKFDKGETYNSYKFIFNKVNLMQYNLIVNFHF